MGKIKNLLKLTAMGSLAGGLLFSATACKKASTTEAPKAEEPKIEQSTTDELESLKQQIKDIQGRLDSLESSMNELLNSTLEAIRNQINELNKLANSKADANAIDSALLALNGLIQTLQEQVKSMPVDEPEIADKVNGMLTSALKVQIEQMSAKSLQTQCSGVTYGNPISGYDRSCTFYYTPENGGNYAFSSASVDLPIVTIDGLKFSKDIDGNEHIEEFNNETNIFTQTLNDLKEATTITKEGDVYRVANDQRTLCRIESRDGLLINSIEEIEATENGGSDIRTSHTFNYDEFNFKEVSTSIGSTMQNYVNYSTVNDAINSIFNNKYFKIEDVLNEYNQQIGELTAVYSNESYAEKSVLKDYQNYYVLNGEEQQSISVNENGEVQESVAPSITKQDFILQVKKILKTGLNSVKYDKEANMYTFSFNSQNKLGKIECVSKIEIKLENNFVEIVAFDENKNVSETCKLNVIMSEKEFLEEFNQILEEIEQHKNENINNI